MQLHSLYSAHPLFQGVYQSLVSIASQLKVILMWVPGHAVITGNEQADAHAGQVARQPCAIPTEDALGVGCQAVYGTRWKTWLETATNKLYHIKDTLAHWVL